MNSFGFNNTGSIVDDGGTISSISTYTHSHASNGSFASPDRRQKKPTTSAALKTRATGVQQEKDFYVTQAGNRYTDNVYKISICQPHGQERYRDRGENQNEIPSSSEHLRFIELTEASIPAFFCHSSRSTGNTAS